MIFQNLKDTENYPAEPLCRQKILFQELITAKTKKIGATFACGNFLQKMSRAGKVLLVLADQAGILKTLQLLKSFSDLNMTFTAGGEI